MDNKSIHKNDFIVYNCFKFVKDNIKYTPDFERPYPEDWKFPVETLCDKYGDCEDGSLLMVSLWLNCNIPSYRCKIALGWALGKNKTKFYHAYPIYLRESDNEWVVMDWNSADVNNFAVWKRPFAKNNPFYLKPDKTFNNEFVWAQKDFEINRNNDGKCKSLCKDGSRCLNNANHEGYCSKHIGERKWLN